MTPAILVTGADRVASQGLAAAVAVEAAALTGAGTLLVEVGARRRGPTLMASSGARELEAALRASGRRASARGHVCHLALGEDESVGGLPAAVADSRAELAVVRAPPARPPHPAAHTRGGRRASPPGRSSSRWHVPGGNGRV